MPEPLYSVALPCTCIPAAVSATTSVHADPDGASDQWLVFEVTDTGCGISQHGLGSLFTEYVQVGAASHKPKHVQTKQGGLFGCPPPGMCCFCLQVLLLSMHFCCPLYLYVIG